MSEVRFRSSGVKPTLYPEGFPPAGNKSTQDRFSVFIQWKRDNFSVNEKLIDLIVITCFMFLLFEKTLT